MRTCKSLSGSGVLSKSWVSEVLTVASAFFILAGLAVSQTPATTPTFYKTVKRIPPFKGRWGAGSPVAALMDAAWSDGSKGGGYAMPDPNFKVPRTPDGQPDIQGIWMVTDTLLGGGQVFDERRQRDRNRGNGSGVIDPPDGKVPYQPWTRTKIAEFGAHYIEPTATCVPKGVPAQLRYIDSQIIQAPGEVLIISEHLQNFRHIPLDGRPHIADNMKLWMGDSRGHWEGNTLVIDVTNQNDKTGFRSDQLHVVERLTPVDADTLQYEATIEDPVVYERPWKTAFPLIRTPDKDHPRPGMGIYEMLEENCADGNQSIDLQLEAGRKLYTGLADLR